MISRKSFAFGQNKAKRWIGGGQRFILFPAGVACKELFPHLLKWNMNIIGFGDNDTTKLGKYLYGLPIYSIEEIINHCHDAYIIISSSKYYDEIYTQFLNAGFDTKHLLPIDYPMFAPDFDQETYLQEHFAQYEMVYDWLADEESRDIFLSLINYRMTFDHRYIGDILSEGQQYFDKQLIQFRENEVFVDCGGFTGDTYAVFNGLCPDYKRYYFFEPNPHNIIAAQQNINNKSRIVFINKGVYEKDDILSFCNSSGASKIDALGESEIKVLKIDSLLSKEPVTFIKMDIEGSELSALKGAKETIQFHRPRLAISIYHHPLDLLQIPMLIKEMDLSYKLYLRHYSNSFTETILYAI